MGDSEQDNGSCSVFHGTQAINVSGCFIQGIWLLEFREVGWFQEFHDLVIQSLQTVWIELVDPDSTPSTLLTAELPARSQQRKRRRSTLCPPLFRITLF
ncbi:unnamed protein product [Calypogeia fissa]